MKKLCIFFTAFLLCSFCSGFVVSAIPDPMYSYVEYGDVFYDLKVDIKDADLIQKAVCDIVEFDYNTNIFADFNHDGIVSVSDVTAIQQFAAGMDLPEGYGGSVDTYYTQIYSIESDYPSETVGKGTTVKFTAHSCGDKDRTVDFLINGEVVQQRGTNNILNYTFCEAGNYTVEARVYNKDGYRNCLQIQYCVLEKVYEVKLYGYGFGPNQKGNFYQLHLVGAIGGTAPYTYCLKIKSNIDGEKDNLSENQISTFNEYIKTHNTDWQLVYNDNETYLYREIYESNEQIIDKDMLDSIENNYCLIIQVNDANGLISDETVLNFSKR